MLKKFKFYLQMVYHNYLVCESTPKGFKCKKHTLENHFELGKYTRKYL